MARFRIPLLDFFARPVTGRTRLVAALKIGFMVLAVLLIMVMIVVSLLYSKGKGYKATFVQTPEEVTKVPEEVAMMKPRFEGVDRYQRPYTVVADKAVQLSDNEVELFGLHADVSTDDKGSWASLSSERGMFHINTELLDLYGAVHLFSGDGYEFRTSEAHVVLHEKRAFGREKVEGQGPLGVLYAQGFSFYGQEDRIVFDGRVKLLFYPQLKQ